MACVPGGKVMAKVMGEPDAFALSTSGFRSFAVFTPADFNWLFRVIAWPLRLISQGITIGFTGDPASPMVEANGMPISMCVAWFSPRLSLSRITAQDASFETTESMPYFLNSPNSWPITIDEQSVNAIMPNRTDLVSGESSAYAPPTHPAGSPAIKPFSADLL